MKAEEESNGDTSRRVSMSIRLPPETAHQLEELASKLNISRTSIISIAIARMHDSDPIMRSNGVR